MRGIGRYEEAGGSLRQSESLRRELRDRRALALALAGRALNAASAGEADLARSLGRKAVALMEESGDIAGIAATEVNLADAEVLLADLPAALIWLNRALAFYPVPGGHRSLGWLHLVRAHVLRQLGDIESSMRSAAAAQEVFTQLGERHGLIAAQRICKEGLPSLPA